MIKKILYLSYQFEFGKPENGKAFNYKAWYENFLKLGYEIEPIFYDSHSKEELQSLIIEKANKIKPDMIFFILQKNQIENQTLEKLKDTGFFSVNFFGDDQWRFDNFSSRYANYFNACITTDKFSIDKYKDIDQNNVIYSQWGSPYSDVKYKDIKYKYDVSFVGGISAYRKWFVSELQKRNIKVHCFGDGWTNGRVTDEEIEQIFVSSKINLNISNSISYDARYLFSSVRNFASTVKSVLVGESKNSSQTKARNFEIPNLGGFQLTDYVPTLDDYYHIGKEIVCYNGIDESEKLIYYYLKHEDERENIKSAGVEKARSEHTSIKRIVGFMRELDKIYDKKR
jgi:spore maturation protein CgeB